MDQQEKWTEENLLSLRWWTDSLLSFTTTRPAGYSFFPGQYSRLGLPGAHGRMVWRAYSIVSAPSQDFLEYYGVIVPEGLFTTRLRDLKPGDKIALDKSVFGFMTPDRFPDGDELWLLATGTGLGPYISMLRDGDAIARFNRVVVVHGARRLEDLSYTEELRDLQKTMGPRLTLVQAVTRETPPLDSGILQGRLTALLADGQLEQAAGFAMDPARARLMLCGNPDMIEELRGMLHERGMRPLRRAAPGHFITENYW